MNIQAAHEFLLKLRNNLIDAYNDIEKINSDIVSVKTITSKDIFIQLPVSKAKEYIRQISFILNPNSEMDDIGKAKEVLSKGYRGNDAAEN